MQDREGLYRKLEKIPNKQSNKLKPENNEPTLLSMKATIENQLRKSTTKLSLAIDI